jgi:DNA-binding protein Fis
MPEHLLHYGVQMASEAPALGDVLTLAEVERRQIERILRHSNGNKSHAAELLGIDRKTLWRKLQRYGISLN